MESVHVVSPLAALNDAELEAIARVAERLFAGRPLRDAGPRALRMRAGAGAEFFDYREYVAGDDPRDIDWRATARSRRPLLRRYQEEASSDWYICIDRSASMASTGGAKWALAAQLGAALAYVLLALNNRVACLLYSDRLDALCPVGRGHRHFSAVLATLGRAPAARGGGSDVSVCLPAIERGANCIVASDFLAADAMRTGCARLASVCDSLHAFSIGSDADFLPGATGPVTLVDAETQEELTVSLDDGLADDARAARRELDGRLAEWCASRAVPLTTADAGLGWKHALLKHLTQFGARGA